MGLFKLIMFVHVAVAAAIGILFWAVLTERYPPMPDLPEVAETYFGAGTSRPNRDGDVSVRPFKIEVEDKVRDDLKKRIKLDLERLSPPLDNGDFTYGFNTLYLKLLAEHWLSKYSWKREEARLNKFDHFKTLIDGIDVHFVHAKPKDPKGKRVLPLLIVHGWPGSFVEFLEIIPLLTTPSDDRDFVFEVVAPSIPGYGFSSAPQKTGFDAAQCARIFRKLMRERLGFETFYTQGGDWGLFITSNLAAIWPESVRGAHFNGAFVNSPSVTLKQILASILPAGWVCPEEDLPKFLPLGEKFSDLMLEMGYMHIQATKPDTVGVALSNSPLGLAAYILEKFSTWTDKANRETYDGNLLEKPKFNLDHLITNVMVYWVTGSITSSMRFYAENLNFDQRSLAFQRAPVPESVPVGIVDAQNEIAHVPKSFLGGKYKNLLRYTDFPKGGHFLAMEEPKLLAKDIFAFVSEAEAQTRQRKEAGNKGEL